MTMYQAEKITHPWYCGYQFGYILATHNIEQRIQKALAPNEHKHTSVSCGEMLSPSLFSIHLSIQNYLCSYNRKDDGVVSAISNNSCFATLCAVFFFKPTLNFLSVSVYVSYIIYLYISIHFA